MKLNRDAATPLTIGAFVLMATTGLLMFFHADMGFNKDAHEWVGLAMIVFVALHVTSNLNNFKKHLFQSRKGQIIIALLVAATAASFWPKVGAGREASPPMVALRAVMGASVADAAKLSDQQVEVVISKLRDAGFSNATPESHLMELSQGDRGKEVRIFAVLFQTTGQPAMPPRP